jgi:hypothetical protein
MVDAPSPSTDDSFPPQAPDDVLVTPSIAEQQRGHAAAAQPIDPTDTSFPPDPNAAPQSIMDSTWAVAGKQLWDAGTRGLGLGARDVIQGASSPVTGLLDAATWPVRAAQRAMGVATTAPSDLVSQGLDAAGLPTPATPTEQNISTINRGAAATLPSLAAGAVPALAAAVPAPIAGLVASPAGSAGQAARTLASGGAGAIAGEKAAGSDLVPWWAKPAVNVAVGALGAGAADVGANLGAKAVNAAAGTMSPVYDAFQRAGIDANLLGTVSGSEAGRGAEAGFGRVPFAASVLRPVQQRAIDQFGDAVERTASQLDPAGTAVTAQRTGEQLQTAARDWQSNVFNGPNGQQAAAWTPLNQRMAGAAVDPTSYRAALTDAAAPPNLASVPANQQAFSNPQASRWLAALDADAPPGQALSWEQAQAIKQRIGDALGTPDIVNSIGYNQLQRIYAGLAQGMQATAVQHGQGALFDAANAVTTQGHQFIANTLSKIIRAANPMQESVTPEQATNNILNSGDSTLQDVRNQMPDAADQLAAFNLRRASTAKPSVATTPNDTSTGTFQTNMNQMQQRTPGGYAALYNTPALQQQLGDLQTVAGALRETQKHVNTSGTAEQLGWYDYMKNIGEAAGELKPGRAAAAIAIPPLFGWGAGTALTSPGLTRYAAGRGAGPAALRPGVAGLLGAGSNNIPTITVRP